MRIAESANCGFPIPNSEIEKWGYSMARIRFANGAPRSRLVVPFPTHMWGDIPAIRWRIPPRPKAVVSCCRDDPSGHIFASFPYYPLLVAKVKTIEGRRWHPAEKLWSLQSLHPRQYEKHWEDKKSVGQFKSESRR